MKEILKYPGCFVCGDKNITGLKARFFLEGNQAVTEVSALEQFEGYRGIYHGGVLSALLDEVMIKAILALGRFPVTAEMTVRFLKPVRTGEKIKLFGKVAKCKGRMFLTEGRATGDSGQVVATASGKYIEADPDLKQTLINSVE